MFWENLKWLCQINFHHPRTQLLFLLYNVDKLSGREAYYRNTLRPMTITGKNGLDTIIPTSQRLSFFNYFMNITK